MTTVQSISLRLLINVTLATIGMDQLQLCAEISGNGMPILTALFTVCTTVFCHVIMLYTSSEHGQDNLFVRDLPGLQGEQEKCFVRTCTD